MHLSREQELALEGELGPAIGWAMSVLVRAGERAGSTRMVPVDSVHIPNWCENPDSKAWAWLGELVGGAEMPITANPGGVEDPVLIGHKRTLAALRTNQAYTCSCAPYLLGNHPSRGEVVAWGGRAATAFANSILGARSEAESFESAVASAITGLTPERKLHLDESRQPTIAVRVPEGIGSDYALLGRMVSHQVAGEVPLICGPTPSYDEAKRFSLAVNHEGRVPLYKLNRAAPPPGLERIDVDALAWKEVLAADGVPELLILGCPHLSEQDINRWARHLSGRRRGKAEAWFFTSGLCLDKCPKTGGVLAARGRVLVDRCPISMLGELDGREVGCDSPALASCLSAAGARATALPHEAIKNALAVE